MDFDAEQEMFSAAEEHFKADHYTEAESLLNQLVLKNSKRPEVFHMLGTIYYDHGKFNKAIRSFRRALEINPGYTDSSVGLSVILNDLGRYEEGQKVFDEARAMLSVKSPNVDHHLNERFSVKHDELGELYLRHGRYEEALSEFQKALALTKIRQPEITVSIAECYIHLNNFPLAIRELRLVVREYPQFVPGRLKLGKCYYDSQQVPEAIEQWEAALRFEPTNTAAKDYLRLAQTIQVTSLNSPELGI